MVGSDFYMVKITLVMFKITFKDIIYFQPFFMPLKINLEYL